MAVEVLHPGLDNNITKDRKDLVRVQYPVLLPQSVHTVKILNLLSNALGTAHDSLHLIYG
jgi:hypothetical protein